MKISKLLPAVGVLAFCVSFGSVRAQDNAAQSAARAALMKQMDQVQAPEPQSPPVAPFAPAVAPKPAAPTPVVEPVAPVAPVAPMVVVVQTNVVVAPPGVLTNARPVPIVAPGLPVSMTKEQRLQALLMLYKADQVTPEQYHTRRAAILAEP